MTPATRATGLSRPSPSSPRGGGHPRRVPANTAGTDQIEDAHTEHQPATPTKETETVDEPNQLAEATTAAEPRKELTRAQKWVVALVATGTAVIAAIGFAGSYTSVTGVAEAQGFGWFARLFTIGVDDGIFVFLALDLLLTWLRIPYPLLRYGAWLLTFATIVFNAASSWPHWLGVSMHAVIPLLFVASVEAARHTIGRLADIVANRHIESPPFIRWFIDPVSTFRIWRCMRLWQLASYEEVIVRQRELAAFRTKLKARHGRRYRRRISEAELLALRLARFGTPIAEALAIPEAEAEAARQAEAQREAEAKRQADAKAEAEAEARREAEVRARAEVEARRIAEAEAAARLAELEARRRVAEAEAAARLAEVNEQRRLVAARAEAERQQIAAEQVEAEAARRRRAAAAEAELLQKRRSAEAEALRVQRAAEVEAEALRVRRAAEAELEALRVQRSAARADVPRQAKSKPEPNLKSEKPKPAELIGRRAQADSEVEAILKLIRAEGYEAVGLERVKADFGLKHGTAFDRLKKARSRFAEESIAIPPQTGTDG